MFLEYGLNAADELVYITEVPSGRVNLRCPYCGNKLLAKKGTVLAHHFAHDGPTCRQIEGRDQDVISLPGYDNFMLRLSPNEFRVLSEIRDDTRVDADDRRYHNRLIERGFVGGRSHFTLTDLGKIPFGDLATHTFAEIQHSMFQQRHKELVDYVMMARLRDDFPDRVTDLRLYRAQWQRVLRLGLYFLEIETDLGMLYKIGVTSRDLNERLPEIRESLARFVRVDSIKPLLFLPMHGSLELYFKHRFKEHQIAIGPLTEYFQHPKPSAILKELGNIGARKLDSFDIALLEGEPDPSEGMRGKLENDEFITLDEWRVLTKAVEGIIETSRLPSDKRWSFGMNWYYKFVGESYTMLKHIGIGKVTASDWGRMYYHAFRDAYFERYHAELEAERLAAEVARKKEEKRLATIEGMKQAKEAGQHVGRPVGTTLSDERFLAKYQEVVEALKEGMSLRQAAEHSGVAVNTVRKVKSLIKE